MNRKSDFPIFDSKPDLVYLDSAATTQKPRVVIDALTRFYSSEYATVHRAVYQLATEASEKYEAVRDKVASFLGAASSDEIVFTKGTTAGINLLAHSLGQNLIPGDVIVIAESEHHSNLVPWQMLAERVGVTLRVVPIDDKGELIMDAYVNLLDEKVKIVSMAHVSNALGTLFPVKKLIDAAHKVGAIFIVDGAQAAAHVPVNVQDLDADFYLFSSHKAYGPTGVGVLYGKQKHLKSMPPFEGGGDMIDTVSLQTSTYAEPPFKFEAGTPQIAEVIGLGAALDYLTTISLDTIWHHEQALLAYATEKLNAIEGLGIVGQAKEKTGIITFTINEAHPLDLATFLDLKNIAVRTGHHCAQPTLAHFNLTGALRLSFGIYTTTSDIDHFASALEEGIALLSLASI